MENVDNNADIVKLEIHVTKTQLITITLIECIIIRTVGGEDFEDAAAFRSLGSWIRRTRKHVYRRTALPWRTCTNNTMYEK